MTTYLFCYGYEDPREWVANQRDGTDFESSGAVWIEAASEEAALGAGVAYAQRVVAELFLGANVGTFPGWRESGYANWIEPDPGSRWSGKELEGLPRIRADRA